MKTQHTPGPWCVASNDFAQWITNEVGKAQIAKAFKPAGMSEETYAANLALLASAPELLAALEECITRDGAVAWRNAEMAGKRLEAISNIARAAIAKAKGSN